MTVSNIPGIAPGKSYIGSIYARLSNVTGRVELVFTFWRGPPSSNTYISTKASNGINGTRDWVQLLLNGVAPAGTQWMRVEMRLWGSGTVWFDDASLKPVEILCSTPTIQMTIP